MHRHSFATIGTHFAITVWDTIAADAFAVYMHECERMCSEFDSLYSRFIDTSLVASLSTQTGVHEVPKELTDMLRMYEHLYTLTEGKITPCIGNTLADLGYDAAYSLMPKDRRDVRSTPPMQDTVQIVDDTHIHLLQHTLLDLGAVGKGFLIDTLYAYLTQQGLCHFLVDGSGDVRYKNEIRKKKEKIKNGLRCALEHPTDPTQAIGIKKVTSGALCASAIGRRAWPDGAGSTLHHYIDPDTSLPSHHIVATWVYAPTATTADALASALFFIEPETLQERIERSPVHKKIFGSIEYCVVDKEMHKKNSAGFAEFFS